MEKILVVDDVETDRRLLGKLVESSGHYAVYAENGQQAMEQAKAHKPALILMDIVMPVQDGFKTTRELKRDPNTSSIPVVLVSSKSQDWDRHWGRRQGAEAHIAKPYAAGSVIEVIHRFAG